VRDDLAAGDPRARYVGAGGLDEHRPDPNGVTKAAPSSHLGGTPTLRVLER
jgi:hypothetical protein